MDYKSIIDNAISDISDFFESEFGYECKKGLQKKIEEYELIIKNDKYDYRGAAVNRKEKRITINKYYSNDFELELFNFVHELLHVLSSKDDLSKKFVEEGIVQLLTYKVLYKKISPSTLIKAYKQDGYRVPVSIMDTVYLINKNSIFQYIVNKDGYNQLLLTFSNFPLLASAMLTKSEKCSSLSSSEMEELSKILIECNYDYSDLCCNVVLIDMIKKMPISDDLMANMPLVIQSEVQEYRRREKEKEKIYECFFKNGFEGLDKISYDFENIQEYSTDVNEWDYLFDTTDKIDDSDTFKLFNQNINNQFLSIALSIIFKNQKIDIEEQLVGLLGIIDSSMVDFFKDSIDFPTKNIHLDSDGISLILGVLLKNELLAESLIERKHPNVKIELEEIVDRTFEKYGVVDYYVVNELFKQYKKDSNNYDEYIKLCNKILSKLEVKRANVIADPNSVWIQGINVTSQNYLQHMSSLNSKKYCSTSDTNYFLQCINYYLLMKQEEDKNDILTISKDWISDEGYFPWENKTIVDNFNSFIECEYSNGYIKNSGNGQMSKLINIISMIRKKSLQEKSEFGLK